MNFRRAFERFWLALFTMTACVSQAWAEPTAIGRRAANAFIITGYERLAGEAELQHAILQGLCASPDIAGIERARSQFAALVKAWSRIEIVRFGPILEDNRIDRMLFWPDRRGIALRQIQSLIAEEDVAALDITTLRQKSIALQGLGSLEYVLFGSGSETLADAGSYRCALGVTIAEAILETAGEVLRAWEASGGIAAHMADPQPEFADYRDEKEVLRELLGVWIHGVELVRDVRLAPLIDTEANPAKPNLALFRRSELTVESIAANVSGMKDLFLLAGMADALSDDLRWVAGSLDFEFQNFARTATEIAGAPIAEAVADPQLQGKIKYLLIVTRSLQNLAVQQVAVSLGLSAGFSSLDGD